MPSLSSAAYLVHKARKIGICGILMKIAKRSKVDEDMIPLYKFTINSPNMKYGVQYGSSPDETVQQAIEGIPGNIDYQDFTFIDLGCGKGSVLAVAHRYPFGRIIGVEFAKELAAEAMRECPYADINLLDVENYEYPDGNLCIYMYNPFEAPVMEKVMAKIAEAAKTRIVYLIYLRPVCKDVVLKYGRPMTPEGWCMTFRIGP